MKSDTFTLRGYQADAVRAILATFAKGDRRTLCVLATGGGKTVVAAHVADHFLAAGKRVLAVAHRDELIRQAAAKFASVTGEMPAIEKADERSDERGMYGKPNVVVASIQTLVSGPPDRRRYRKFDPKEFGLLWIDEAHHGTADTYRETVDYFTAANPELSVLYVTATPDRADKIGLGEICESVAFVFDLADLIADGYLVPIRQRSVVIEGLDFAAVRTTAGELNQGDLETAMMLEKPLHGIAHATIESACDLPKGTLAAFRDRPDFASLMSAALDGKRRRRTLVFTVTVAHAKAMSEIFNRWIPGSADYVDGAMPPDRRKQVLSAYKTGRIQFLCNCMIATEGFDEPGVEMVVMARPTKSRALAVQMTGRGTRPADAIAGVLGTVPDAAGRRAMIAASVKPAMSVLDFVGNSGQHKLMTVADVLGGVRYEDAVLARAAEIAADRAAAGDGTEVDAEAALAEAADEVELERAAERVRAELASLALDAEEEERRRAEHAAKRANLRATADYTVSEVDPFDAHAVAPARGMAPAGGGASDAQIGLLVKLGVRRETAAGYTKRQASAVIEGMKAKRCTSGQRQWLTRLGYDGPAIDAMNFDAASAAIDAAKQNDWRRADAPTTEAA